MSEAMNVSTESAQHAPGRWVTTGQGRARARLSARTRHPVAWLNSALSQRRGVETERPIPAGADEVLQRLAEMPLSVWTYGFDHPSVRHMGPMAQDFAAAFGLGSTDQRIAAVDANGVCMVAVQALHRRLIELETEVAQLRSAREEL
ncbi:tail fiber domain-containing protein [Rhodococcus sp. NPDC058514]|uniref:tail fiber domain-containing protein n=1 Tax=unclassified Rhodococcus (in: high G+C Gram-positive bacteria) TaxID=192944 RepID=UPI00365EC55F